MLFYRKFYDFSSRISDVLRQVSFGVRAESSNLAKSAAKISKIVGPSMKFCTGTPRLEIRRKKSFIPHMIGLQLQKRRSIE